MCKEYFIDTDREAHWYKLQGKLLLPRTLVIINIQLHVSQTNRIKVRLQDNELFSAFDDANLPWVLHRGKYLHGRTVVTENVDAAIPVNACEQAIYRRSHIVKPPANNLPPVSSRRINCVNRTLANQERCVH